MIASGLKNKTEHEQVGTLLYVMGAYTLSQQCGETYTEVRAEFNSFFAAWSNTIVEQARLNTREQALEESVDTFIQNLYPLAEYREYGTLQVLLIRDRIVAGVLGNIYSMTVSDRLLAKLNLTLAKTKKENKGVECQEKRNPTTLIMLIRLVILVARNTLCCFLRLIRLRLSWGTPSFHFLCICCHPRESRRVILFVE